MRDHLPHYARKKEKTADSRKQARDGGSAHSAKVAVEHSAESYDQKLWMKTRQ